MKNSYLETNTIKNREHRHKQKEWLAKYRVRGNASNEERKKKERKKDWQKERKEERKEGRKKERKTDRKKGRKKERKTDRKKERKVRKKKRGRESEVKAPPRLTERVC